ncbi:type II toxin-antitoxin system PemK/MazF family toxin [Paenibacillus polymyxa]|uniref:type II toxin-antitoxin system PemK/MazF family toxin n=1 Tax=Paenibacillus polymyxa TaxID=1406 RepID=UPI002AB40A5B|nr:type II toxin-antitoxin system PemK/MazF family toxin [Paenibacillus polymyxa]MDY8023370.1 type II toxin-antitoxin system PemK/MazF family toxin [Paenibacillus polymyxa]
MNSTLERERVDAKLIKKFDVWQVDLGKASGSVQAGERPVMVISNNIGNKYSPVIVVVPITSQLKKAKLPTHVLIKKEDCEVDRDSVVQFEQHITVPKDKFDIKFFEMPEKYRPILNNALHMSTADIQI